jgi:hypothetical protein
MRGDDTLVHRDRGFLTEHDREYLTGQLEEMPTNREKQKRYQIRERFRHAMYDFRFMSEQLSNRDKDLLWIEIDNWLWRAQNRRQKSEDYEYPELPELVKCWRDLISLFVECHVLQIPEAEDLATWIIESGVNKGVRRKRLRVSSRYQEMDANLDWGGGELTKLEPYLRAIASDLPADPEEAEERLLELYREGYLRSADITYLRETYVQT